VSNWTVAKPYASSEFDQRPRPTIWKANMALDPSVSNSPEAELPPPAPAAPARLPSEMTAKPAVASAVASQAERRGRWRRITQAIRGTNTTCRPVRKPDTAAETSRSPKVCKA
jgi:hypothetical protein